VRFVFTVDMLLLLHLLPVFVFVVLDFQFSAVTTVLNGSTKVSVGECRSRILQTTCQIDSVKAQMIYICVY